METIYNGATQIPFVGARPGNYVAGAPFRGVIHTTESKDYRPSTTSYYGHNNPPHFTLANPGGNAELFQHYPINRSARALANPSKSKNDTQTNRMSAIQIEVCWYADEIAQLPAGMKAALRTWMRWVEAQTGVQRLALTFFPEKDAEGENARSRMSVPKWQHFNGWCGHQHVPENAHWDPGEIDIAFLLS